MRLLTILISIPLVVASGCDVFLYEVGDERESCLDNNKCNGDLFCLDGKCRIPEYDCKNRWCGLSPNKVFYCGTCPGETDFCTSDGRCQDDCTGRLCGPSPNEAYNCGSCGSNEECNESGLCECEYEVCDIVCCAQGEICNEGSCCLSCNGICCEGDDVCYNNECCTKKCNGKCCGEDGCGGTCTDGCSGTLPICDTDSCSCEGDCQNEDYCEDNDTCTVDVCVHNECVHSPAESTVQCDDENVCTSNDMCDGEGGCVGTIESDFTFCSVETTPDIGYDICIGGDCVSPGTCEDATCNSPGPHFELPRAVGHDSFEKTESIHGQPIVIDAITGLVWQGCIAGLSGSACTTGQESLMTWKESVSYCDSLEWAGETDWYLPDIHELQSIVDYGRVDPSIDPNYFPNLPTLLTLWGSSTNAAEPTKAWWVTFSDGRVNFGADKTTKKCARCVRRSPSTLGNRFVRNTTNSNHPTVSDTYTGLEWQGCHSGLLGKDCSNGTGEKYDYIGAKKYCSDLVWDDKGNWRLPNVKELSSIIDSRIPQDPSYVVPSVSDSAFPNLRCFQFWSSTPYASDPNLAWRVGFNGGYVDTGGDPTTTPYWVICVRRDTGLEWIQISGGTFMMGSPIGEPGRDSDETQHLVTISGNFFMKATEVTQAEFEDRLGYNPGSQSLCGPECAVMLITWSEAAAYCNALSVESGLSSCYVCTGADKDIECSFSSTFASPYDCPGFRLPTEAEWEYAARAGTTESTYYGTFDENHLECEQPNTALDPIAWFCGNSGHVAHPVAQMAPNNWGLYDMLGGVWEYCHDWHGEYGDADVVDPWGPAEGEILIRRGGYWDSHANLVRSASRFADAPGSRHFAIGLRPVRNLP